MILFLFLSFLFATNNTDLEAKKINCLINQVRYTKATFIRNGTKHNSRDAANHIQMKYKKAVNTGFPFYKKRKISTGLFIDKVASVSSFSGKPYKIKESNKTVLVKDWLNKKLKENCQTHQVL